MTMIVEATTRFMDSSHALKWDLRLGIRSNPNKSRLQRPRSLRSSIREKPPACTADELHYVPAPNSDWQLALWRYLPPFNRAPRNHPLLLLSGVGTNAVGYDLSPQSSFARYMAGHGFDTWILEVRGTGLSMRRLESIDSEQHADSVRSGRSGQVGSSTITAHVRNWGQRLLSIIGEGHRSVSPQTYELHEHLSGIIADFRKQIQLLSANDCDFDHYLKEDVPAVMEYIRTESKTRDGKLLAIGHSMGGILLYALLSLCGSQGQDSGLSAVITLASSLDYTTSRSSLKLLLPLTDPAQALNVPAIPIGALFTAMYPLAARPPFLLSWLNSQISAQDMMLPELFEKLVLKNFCTVPAKLLLQLATAFQEGGLRDRNGTFFYKHHLRKCSVPILALAGDRDLICPPEAVYETVKMIPEDLITYRVLGEAGGPHYAHYDLVGCRLAAKQVYPCIIEFLARHDNIT